MAPRIDLPGPLGRIDVPLRWRRPCSVNHWGEGVLVAATPPIDPDGWWMFSEVPNGIAGDGNGGAFVLSTAIEGWGGHTQDSRRCGTSARPPRRDRSSC
jgi:hypothetical protein